MRIFAAYWPYFFPRGIIEDPKGEIKTEIELVNPGRFGFFPRRVARMFLEQVSRFKPDLVFIGDGHWYKLYLADLISRHYPTAVRFYAYEILCPRNTKLANHDTLFCQNDYFQNPDECIRCIFGSIDGMKNIEAWLSGMFLGSRAEWGRQALARCRKLFVNNFIAQGRLEGINRNTVVVTSGVDCGFFTPTKKRADSSPVLLAVGRFDDPLKGIKNLLEACKSLWNEGEKFTLLTVGGRGKLPDMPFVENIDWINYSDIVEVYRRADVVAVPSLWQEPFGMVAVEAMACAKPVIASNVGGLKGIVKHEQTGLLVEPTDIEGWKAAIKRLIKNEDERKAMGQKGREAAEKYYDWSHIVASYEWDKLI